MIVGFVLAGGQSRRFGSNKALHQLDGQPMVAHAAQALSSLCDHVFGVSASVSDEVNEEQALTWIHDSEPGRGPLGGIHRALQQAQSLGAEVAVVVGCDMPRLQTAAIKELIDAVRGGEAIVAAPRLDDRWEALHAAYDVDQMMDPIAAAIAADRLGLQSLFRTVGAVDVTEMSQLPDFVWRRSTTNINRLRDLG